MKSREISRRRQPIEALIAWWSGQTDFQKVSRARSARGVLFLCGVAFCLVYSCFRLLLSDSGFAYQCYPHGEVERIIELRRRGRQFTTRYFDYYVLSLDEAVEHVGCERADAVQYLW